MYVRGLKLEGHAVYCFILSRSYFSYLSWSSMNYGILQEWISRVFPAAQGGKRT